MLRWTNSSATCPPWVWPARLRSIPSSAARSKALGLWVSRILTVPGSTSSSTPSRYSRTKCSPLGAMRNCGRVWKSTPIRLSASPPAWIGWRCLRRIRIPSAAKSCVIEASVEVHAAVDEPVGAGDERYRAHRQGGSLEESPPRRRGQRIAQIPLGEPGAQLPVRPARRAHDAVDDPEDDDDGEGHHRTESPPGKRRCHESVFEGHMGGTGAPSQPAEVGGKQ